MSADEKKQSMIDYISKTNPTKAAALEFAVNMFSYIDLCFGDGIAEKCEPIILAQFEEFYKQALVERPTDKEISLLIINYMGNYTSGDDNLENVRRISFFSGIHAALDFVYGGKK